MIWNWALLLVGALPFCAAQQQITVTRFACSQLDVIEIVYFP